MNSAGADGSSPPGPQDFGAAADAGAVADIPTSSTSVLRTAASELRSAVAQLFGGLGTALLALLLAAWLLLVTALCLVGVGVLLAPGALRAVRTLADRERARQTRWGRPCLPAGPLRVQARLFPAVLRALRPHKDPGLADGVREGAGGQDAGGQDAGREVRWLLAHATLGLLVCAVGVLLPVYAVRDLSYPLWWKLLPADLDSSPWWWSVRNWPDALQVALLGLGWAAFAVGLTPRLARWHAGASIRLLAPAPGTDLTLRVAELTVTRAAALEAHTSELRRIERALHDGTQNRLVAVTVLLGAAARSLDRMSRDLTGAARHEAAGYGRPGHDGPADDLARDDTYSDDVRSTSGSNVQLTADIVDKAQQAAEQALAELRTVVRSILPPVLQDRGLAGAISGLAAASPVPCQVQIDFDGPVPAAVEATAYFAVAEALTNVARHSGARSVQVRVRREVPQAASRERGGQSRDELVLQVEDDGIGGATVRADLSGTGSTQVAGTPGGTGLRGIRGRVQALDGTLQVISPAGGPTRVEVRLPCGS